MVQAVCVGFNVPCDTFADKRSMIRM